MSEKQYICVRCASHTHLSIIPSDEERSASPPLSY